jgi:hypothetical protein
MQYVPYLHTWFLYFGLANASCGVVPTYGSRRKEDLTPRRKVTRIEQHPPISPLEKLMAQILEELVRE